jgi:hypothetical protein
MTRPRCANCRHARELSYDGYCTVLTCFCRCRDHIPREGYPGQRGGGDVPSIKEEALALVRAILEDSPK